MLVQEFRIQVLRKGALRCALFAAVYAGIRGNTACLRIATSTGACCPTDAGKHGIPDGHCAVLWVHGPGASLQTFQTIDGCDPGGVAARPACWSALVGPDWNRRRHRLGLIPTTLRNTRVMLGTSCWPSSTSGLASATLLFGSAFASALLVDCRWLLSTMELVLIFVG